MPSYFSVVTLAGQQKIADAVAGGDDISITHLAVGDGNGSPTTPAAGATALVHEVWRGSVTSAVRDPSNPTQVVVSATVPVGAGPFSIREAAIITADGELFAIANYPETYKPSPSEGVASELVIEFVVVVDTAAAVTITISPSSMIAAHLLLRQPFIAVDSMTVTAPPGSPALGAMHVVPPAATGAWVGHTHHLAQWTGSEWVFADAPVRTVVGVIDQGLYFRRTADGWVPFNATETERGLIRLASTADLAAREASSAVTPALLGKFGLDMPMYPEVLTATAALDATATTGQVVLNPGQAWVHRGLHRYGSDNFSAPARTFATAASKTYHWKWYAPGHALAPAGTYPFGRLMLRDLADAGYNPSALAETDVAFDAGLDEVFIGRVTTNAGNVPTFKPLKNRARLSFRATQSGTPTDPAPFEFGYTITHSGDVDWARRPSEATMHGHIYAGAALGGNYYVSGGTGVTLLTLTRYGYSFSVITDWAESNGLPYNFSAVGYTSLGA